MAIPVYLWLKDDGGADIKGSVDVNDWEGSIGYTINDARQEVEYFNTKLENVKVVKVAPKMHDVKDPAKEKHNHLELVELRYEKFIWTY
ncbi:type VI secretion system tube protein Hcp, partial [Pseudomonas putida]|uniref:type VI secretion system tube protein Hcp n=1 Tax=Pseudomonas putida TaxID=303 RepID=UPI0035716CAB